MFKAYMLRRPYTLSYCWISIDKWRVLFVYELLTILSLVRTCLLNKECLGMERYFPKVDLLYSVNEGIRKLFFAEIRQVERLDSF